jgi:hypothetical protein
LLASTITGNATLNSIATSAKPSFLVMDRIYQKVAGPEEVWLLRALEVATSHYNAQLLKSEALRCVHFSICDFDVSYLSRIQYGSVFIHLAVNGATPQMRRDTLTSLQTLSTTYPEMVNRVARDALVAYNSKAPTVAKAVASAGDDAAEDKSAANRQSRLSAFLYTCAAFDEGTDVSVKQRLLADLLIIAHHEDICKLPPLYHVIGSLINHPVGGNARYTWIELVQKASLDPHVLAVAQVDRLLKLVLEASNVR